MQTASAPARQAVPLAIRDRLANMRADRLLRQAGATWFEILADPALAAVSTSPDVLFGWPAHWRSALRVCGQCGVSLGDRERSFVQSLAAYRRRPSPRQLAWLHSITERMIEAGGGR